MGDSVPHVEPIPGEPAALADTGTERALVIADYHAGLEAGLRSDGVEVRSRAPERRRNVRRLLHETRPDRLVFLGDLGDAIGRAGSEERTELADLLDAVTRVPVTVTKGNHDGGIEEVVADFEHVTVTDGPGVRIGDVGFAHGHTWPTPEACAAPILCTAHEHPLVRLEDEVGATRKERVWLRGRLAPDPFRDHHGAALAVAGELVVFPGFNDLSGGTWVNVGDEFLSPFLPEGLADGEAYLLDGTRLGDYRRV